MRATTNTSISTTTGKAISKAVQRSRFLDQLAEHRRARTKPYHRSIRADGNDHSTARLARCSWPRHEFLTSRPSPAVPSQGRSVTGTSSSCSFTFSLPIRCSSRGPCRAPWCGASVRHRNGDSLGTIHFNSVDYTEVGCPYLPDICPAGSHEQKKNESNRKRQPKKAVGPMFRKADPDHMLSRGTTYVRIEGGSIRQSEPVET